jgi:hypothetical protein
MAYTKLHKKSFTIAVKTGTDANSTKFAKEAVTGELYLATDTGVLYKATSDAGASDATLVASNDLNGSTLFGFTAKIENDATTAYSVTSADNGKIIALDNAGAIAVTIPSGLGEGFNCSFVQKGAGVVTFTATSPATLANRQGHTKTGGQDAVVSIVAIASDDLVLSGDTAP